MIGEFVTGDPDHPWHRLQLRFARPLRSYYGSERLLRQVFGKCSVAEHSAAQVPIHLIEGSVVELGTGVGQHSRLLAGCRRSAHTPTS